MFMPDKNGVYICEDCDMQTTDLFEVLEHCEIKFIWDVRMSGQYHFDLFLLLENLNELMREGHYDTAREYIQGVTLCYANSFDGGINIQKMFEEIITRKNTNKIIEGMENMLKDENSAE